MATLLVETNIYLKGYVGLTLHTTNFSKDVGELERNGLTLHTTNLSKDLGELERSVTDSSFFFYLPTSGERTDV